MDRRQVCRAAFVALFAAGLGLLQPQLLYGKPRCLCDGTAGTDGQFVTFDHPDSIDTEPQSINPAGAITGYYVDANGTHGFLRAPDGTITPFDVPNAVATGATSINPAGAITGAYSDANDTHPTFRSHGFLRAPDGTFTTFDVPNSPFFPVSINPAGAITGSYYQAVNGSDRGFLRAPDGTLTTFDAPNSTETFPNSINPVGAITGVYGANGRFHGFLRCPSRRRW